MKTSFTSYTKLLIALITLSMLSSLHAKDQATSGRLKGTLVYATNTPEGDAKAQPISGLLKKLISKKGLAYKHYYTIGSDSKPIKNGSQNHLQPNSQIKISFEPLSGGKGVALDYWQGGKKTFSTKTATLQERTPLIISGPSWRQGKVLIILEKSGQ